MLHPFNLQKDNKLFESQTSQLTVKIAQDLIKRLIWTKLTQNYPLQLQDIPTEKAIFVATKDEKNKYGSYSNLHIYFLHFKFFARNIKNQVGTIVLLQLSYNSRTNSKLLRYLAQLGTPANIQNNYIKLSGFTFRLDVTKFLHREKLFYSKILSHFFMTNVTHFSYFTPLNFILKWYQ